MSAVVDYRKFLGSPKTLVLPYFGGPSVFGDGRRLRVGASIEPGFWRFELAGRVAMPSERADPPDLSRLPCVRGHLVGAWLFQGGAAIERVELPPPEEPEIFSPLRARRWESGELLFDGVEFEGAAEELVRRRLEDGGGIDDVKGVGATLRTAFAFAMLARRGAALGIAVSPLESPGLAHAVASSGRDAADALLTQRAESRRRERERLSLAATLRREEARAASAAQAAADVERRAATALERAGAELIGVRRLGANVEVTFRFLGERFISVVDLISLQVYDAGICLSGSDRLVNLGSLPSVIREAMNTNQLNITRR